MNCKECAKRRCPSFGSSEKCNVCLYTGGDYLEVRDWLSDIDIPSAGEPFDCVEVRFKNGRKDFYRNVNQLPLSVGDIVAVESNPGHDIGCVMLTGELMRLQMRRKKENPENPEIKKIYRIATQKDIDIWQTAISREKKTLVRTREICDNLGLVMKLSDVEYQGDNLKATFYYTAEGRVDFRQLIKELAGAFGVRVEMRQIGLRQEAARVGSIGSCGRELCCTTWLTDFRSVNTSAARTQRLSLNPQKLAGQCGKLKCCLNFELDVYVDALKGFPHTDTPLKTEKGIAFFQKMDVFKGMYWYAYDFEIMNWIGLHVEAVAEIQALNRRGERPESMEMYVEQEESRPKDRKQEGSELKAVEEGELTRFDKRSSGKGRRDDRRRGDRRRDDRPREPRQERENGGENGQPNDRRDARPDNRRRDDRPREPRQERENNGENGQPNDRRDARSDNRRRDDRSREPRRERENDGENGQPNNRREGRPANGSDSRPQGNNPSRGEQSRDQSGRPAEGQRDRRENRGQERTETTDNSRQRRDSRRRGDRRRGRPDNGGPRPNGNDTQKSDQ